jgi:lysophospholipase L1-like esterase
MTRSLRLLLEIVFVIVVATIFLVQGFRSTNLLDPHTVHRPSSKRDWHPQEFRKAVALGESTTAGGWSTSPERCWVPVLASLINDFQTGPLEFVNSGIGANVVSTRSPAYQHSGRPAASERLEKHVIAHAPDLVVISYGLNDARGATPLELFQKELVGLVTEIRQHIQPLIVLVGPYYMTGFELYGPHWNHADLPLFQRYNSATEAVAIQEDCLFVDVLAANGDTPWMVHHDGVHANDLGHRIIANRIFEVLAQHCSGLAQKTKEAEQNSPRWRDESVLRSDYGF